MSEEIRPCLCKCCSQACKCQACTEQVPRQNKEIDRLKAALKVAREAGNDLAKIAECFCDDLVAYKGVCETCKWKEALALIDGAEGRRGDDELHSKR